MSPSLLMVPDAQIRKGPRIKHMLRKTMISNQKSVQREMSEGPPGYQRIMAEEKERLRLSLKEVETEKLGIPKKKNRTTDDEGEDSPCF